MGSQGSGERRRETLKEVPPPPPPQGEPETQELRLNSYEVFFRDPSRLCKSFSPSPSLRGRWFTKG